MRRRPDPAPAPTFTAADVYRLQLMPREQFVALRGEPSAELLDAVAAYQARQARNGEDHRQRTAVDWAVEDDAS